MEITQATADDTAAIREVADRSMAASYALSPGTIEAILDEQFDDDRLAALADDDGAVLLVAIEAGNLAGFVEGIRENDTGTITWLHVATEFRGQGVGSTLFDAACEALRECGAETLRARDFADNAEGQGFFEHLGFEGADQDRLDINGEPHIVEIYAESEAALDGEDETDTPPQESVTTEDGEVSIDRDDELAGESGPFFVAYSDSDHEEPYGFYCGNCESIVEAVDSLDRIECGTCGNLNKPQQWDGSYL